MTRICRICGHDPTAPPSPWPSNTYKEHPEEWLGMDFELAAISRRDLIVTILMLPAFMLVTAVRRIK